MQKPRKDESRVDGSGNGREGEPKLGRKGGGRCLGGGRGGRPFRSPDIAMGEPLHPARQSGALNIFSALSYLDWEREGKEKTCRLSETLQATLLQPHRPAPRSTPSVGG